MKNEKKELLRTSIDVVAGEPPVAMNDTTKNDNKKEDTDEEQRRRMKEEVQQQKEEEESKDEKLSPKKERTTKSDETKQEATVLTDEQRERKRKNRERAHEILRKKQKQKMDQQQQSAEKEGSTADKEEQCEHEFEDFEITGSKYITKQEATRMYCIPNATLDCIKDVVMKPNPMKSKFKPMKLYRRTSLRVYAYKRYGSVEALRAERSARQQKQSETMMRQTKNIFK